MESLGDILSYILKQFHSFIPDSELEESIPKYIPVPSNVPPSAPLGNFLRGVLKKIHKIWNCRKINSYKNPFLLNSFAIWSSPISKSEPRGNVTNKFRNKVNVEERCKSRGGNRTWRISEQLVLAEPL